MKLHFTRRYRFSAAHRLHCPELSEQQNRDTYGKCNNPHGHGHNYALEVTVSGPVDACTGMICNMVDLDSCVQREVLDRFDHDNLNCAKEFAKLVPTTENLAVVVFEILKRAFTHAHLERVRIEETSMNSFEYAGGGELRE